MDTSLDELFESQPSIRKNIAEHDPLSMGRSHSGKLGWGSQDNFKIIHLFPQSRGQGKVNMKMQTEILRTPGGRVFLLAFQKCLQFPNLNT